MDNKQPYVLWGSSGHAKVLASLINLIGGNVVALFDHNPDISPALNNVPLYIGLEGFNSWLNKGCEVKKISGIAAIGGSRGRDRQAIHNLFRSHNLSVRSLIHPSASICSTAFIGQGSQVLAQAVIAADAKLGEDCIINHRALADHECVIGNGVHLAPSSTLCGCVTLGSNVMVGAGAVILPRLKIGANTIIGAGAVVTRDLPDNVVAVGNPARIIRNI
jgi:sugar O-acyltransferase (sialic acid O-acetyltransferase NeuD family)